MCGGIFSFLKLAGNGGCLMIVLKMPTTNFDFMQKAHGIFKISFKHVLTAGSVQLLQSSIRRWKQF